MYIQRHSYLSTVPLSRSHHALVVRLRHQSASRHQPPPPHRRHHEDTATDAASPQLVPCRCFSVQHGPIHLRPKLCFVQALAADSASDPFGEFFLFFTEDRRIVRKVQHRDGHYHYKFETDAYALTDYEVERAQAYLEYRESMLDMQTKLPTMRRDIRYRL